ncbi:hypothetical protein [Paracoccus sp. ME4]|uniref:hypothetical protein n=1 Tax=Paracoccus sp. ME4 TaxID=3138066 RepID=UPI00398BBA29
MKIDHRIPVLFLCEKRHTIQRIASAWRKLHPDTPCFAIALCSGSPGGFSMRLPRSLPISAVPAIYEPLWAVSALQVYDQDVAWQDVDGVDLITGWKGQIVCACDPDPAGSYVFRNLLRLARPDLADDHFPDLWLKDLSEKTIISAMSDPGSTAYGRRVCLLAMAEAKRFFDANWAVNALPTFRQVLCDVAVPPEHRFLSKYALQLLYELRNRVPLTESDILKLMCGRVGTGKYGQLEHEVAMGSAASRSTILDTLKAMGLISVSETRDIPISAESFAWRVARGYSRQEDPHVVTRDYIAISDRGRALLDRIHPKTRDPDLPFRLLEWGRTWPESRPQIERYIRTVFGRQKRFAPGRSANAMPA